MFDFLEKLRQKPDHVKKQIASNLEPSPLETFSETFKEGMFTMGENLKALKESITLLSSDPAFYSTTTAPLIISSTTTESQN